MVGEEQRPEAKGKTGALSQQKHCETSHLIKQKNLALPSANIYKNGHSASLRLSPGAPWELYTILCICIRARSVVFFPHLWQHLWRAGKKGNNAKYKRPTHHQRRHCFRPPPLPPTAGQWAFHSSRCRAFAFAPTAPRVVGLGLRTTAKDSQTSMTWDRHIHLRTGGCLPRCPAHSSNSSWEQGAPVFSDLVWVHWECDGAAAWRATGTACASDLVVLKHRFSRLQQ